MILSEVQCTGLGYKHTLKNMTKYIYSCSLLSLSPFTGMAHQSLDDSEQRLKKLAIPWMRVVVLWSSTNAFPGMHVNKKHCILTLKKRNKKCNN